MDVPPASVLGLAARASVRVRTAPSADALHTAALIDLMWAGNRRNSLDRSISFMRMAATLTDRPATIYLDLSAAYLARGRLERSTRDLLRAVDYASKAVALDSGRAAARFDLALALDRAGLANDARDAWAAYLLQDSTSRWAAEARKRMAAIDSGLAAPPGLRASTAVNEPARLAAADPIEAQRIGWEVTLGAWGSAVAAHQMPEAESLLAIAERLGDALVQQGGDGTLADAVRAIRAHAADGRATRSLARAHVTYARARADYRAGRYRLAGRELRDVIHDAAVSPPLRAWAAVFRGAALVYVGDRREGERALGAVARSTDARRHPSLAGRAWWSLGTTLARRGLDERALAAYARAAPLFARAGEREHLGAVQCLEMEAEFALGRAAKGYQAMGEALGSLATSRRSVWLHNVLDIASLEAARDGLERAALALNDEDVATAEYGGRPADRVEARLARAQRLEADGATVRAETDIARARGLLPELRHRDQRGWFEADLRLAEAGIWGNTDPRRALRALDSVVAYFGQPPNPTRLLPALVARARAHLALGDLAAAAADLDRSTALVTRERAAVAAAPLRQSLLASARPVFDRAVMMHVDRGQPRRALRRLDLARAALVPAHPGGARPIVAPRDVTLDYALIGDTLLIWTVRGGATRLWRGTVRSGALREDIAAVRADAEVRAADTVMRTALARLYTALVAPVRAQLGPAGAPLIVIADGMLADVPFAGLFDAQRGRYLVEDHPLRRALSLSQADEPPPAPLGRDPSVLVVADPAFDRREHPDLSRLVAARREAASVASLYPHARVLAGVDATPGVVRAALLHTRVAHIAAHALFDPLRPEESTIVLASPDRDGGSGALTAADIAGLDLRRLQLVVLSACQTVRAPDAAGGLAGIAGAFLSAGAGGVVGSLWRVDDGPTAALMTAFHRAYHQSGAADRALRAAQLELLRSRDPVLRSPASWAAFTYVGR